MEAEVEKVPSDYAAASAPQSDRQSRESRDRPRPAPHAIEGCAWPAAWCNLQAVQQAAEELRGVVEEREAAAAGLEMMPQMPPPPPPVRLRGLGLRGNKRGSARLVLGSIEEAVLNSNSWAC